MLLCVDLFSVAASFRGLEFIREFLLEFASGVSDLQQAANTAYSPSLKPFHSYVVRGVFTVSRTTSTRYSLLTMLNTRLVADGSSVNALPRCLHCVTQL